MDKAFDFAVLAAKLKDRGLDLAEEALKIVVEETLDWTQESVVLTENKFDDMAIAFIPSVKAAMMEAVDKVDGKVG